MLFRELILAAVVFIMAAAPCFSANIEKQRDIQRLMMLLDVASMPEKMADVMIANILLIERKRFPDMPNEVESAISKAIKKQMLKHGPELFQLLAPLYDKYYTHSEIIGLIKFFESPVGRKHSVVSMSMMKDILPVAQAWGNRFGASAAEEVGKELNRIGY